VWHERPLTSVPGFYAIKADPSHLAAKRQKMELKLTQIQERRGTRADDKRIRIIKERMQKKKLEHKDRMLPYQFELTRLDAQMASGSNSSGVFHSAVPSTVYFNFPHNASWGHRRSSISHRELVHTHLARCPLISNWIHGAPRLDLVQVFLPRVMVVGFLQCLSNNHLCSLCCSL
jgi:hypothetical protein